MKTCFPKILLVIRALLGSLPTPSQEILTVSKYSEYLAWIHIRTGLFCFKLYFTLVLGSSKFHHKKRWSIKARVTKKSDIRNYTNDKGPGKLFSFDLIDATGEIRATGFNQSVDKFYDMLHVDSVSTVEYASCFFLLLIFIKNKGLSHFERYSESGQQTILEA